MNYKFYYNNVPGKGFCRNNLIYTSLVNEDYTRFVQWYYNDTEYHLGQNEVVDSALMEDKWRREVKNLIHIDNEGFANYLPRFEVDYEEQKIILEIQGPDFWEQSGCLPENYDSVLPNWQDQMLEIFQMHKELGIYKFSLHPSSYFVVNGRLKSINYFFAYHQDEPKVNVRDHLSHISSGRRKELFPQMQAMGIDLDSPQEWNDLQVLCLESFSDQYPRDFIEKAKSLYV